MALIVKRIIGALLVLLGLLVLAVGMWFTSHLDASGAARFEASLRGDRPVLLQPDLLNRIDGPVSVTATTAGDGQVWMGLVSPRDATQFVGKAAYTTITGVDPREWRAVTADRGAGDLPDPAKAEIWRDQVVAAGQASLTIEQAQAPETLLITAKPGPLTSVVVTFTEKAWFVKAVVGALLGVFLLLAGALLLWSARPGRRTIEEPA